MKGPILLIFGIALGLGSCAPAEEPVETGSTEEAAPAQILVHAVYFDLIDSLPTAALDTFVQQLGQLRDIEEVRNFQLGRFQDVGDPRALSDYEWVILMSFADTIAYRAYQEHSIHLSVKAQIGKYLAAKPASYDFLTQ